MPRDEVHKRSVGKTLIGHPAAFLRPKLGDTASQSMAHDLYPTQILYVVVLPPEDAGKFSPFQGFSLNTFEVASAVQHLCSFPATIDELFLRRDEAIWLRTLGVGGYTIALLDAEFVDEVSDGAPIICFVSGRETRERVERHLSKNERSNWLHLTTDETSTSTTHLADFSRARMYAWARAVVETTLAERFRERASTSGFKPFVEWASVNAPVSTRFHNITLPTEAAIHSLGFAIPDGKRLIGNPDDEFAEALVEAADALERLCSESTETARFPPGVIRLIVTVPSVFRRLSPASLRHSAPQPVRRVMRHILRQKQYTAMRTSEAEAREIFENPLASGLMKLRAEEMRAYTSALSVAAASLCAPVLRCPPQVDRVRELLIRLAGSVGRASGGFEKRHLLARNVGKALRQAIPQPLLDRIERHRGQGIKLIGDTPFELLPVDDLPLGLRATTSRLPTLPGNLLMRQCLVRIPMVLHARDMKRILVVRAFEPSDPVRNSLERAAYHMRSFGSALPDLEFVDVSNKDEFVSAFSDFDGPIAIFDGHGAQSRSDPQGTISVGSVKFNPFELYGKIQMPPIVLLSACETHTLEGTESSVASALLFMGARSVLGTLLPIDATHAAILIARFLLRFGEFLPLLRSAIPWSEVVSGMLRMSYASDVLRTMEARFRFGEEAYKRIGASTNAAINEFRDGWFEQMLNGISEQVSRSEAEIRDIWLRTCYFTETLHYVHLGQPEHIFVTPDDAHEPVIAGRTGSPLQAAEDRP